MADLLLVLSFSATPEAARRRGHPLAHSGSGPIPNLCYLWSSGINSRSADCAPPAAEVAQRDLAGPHRDMIATTLLLTCPLLSEAWTSLYPAPMRCRCVGQQRCLMPRCLNDDRIDKLVLYGDVGVLVGYGVVQSAADTLLLPLAASQPELFTQSQPVLSAQWQGIALAALWAGFTMALNGYRPSATRTLPSRAAFIPLCAAWFGSSVVLLSTCAGLGLPLEAETEFVFGSATVVGGWRLLYSGGLPLV